jgi:ribulose bisphosphate carboxylase small subunit
MQQAAAAAAATQQGLQQFMAVGAVSGYPQELQQQQQVSTAAAAAAGACSSQGPLAMQQVQQQTDVLLPQGFPTVGQQQQQVPTMMEWQQQHELQLKSAEGSTSTELFSFLSSSDSQVSRASGGLLLHSLASLVNEQLCAQHAVWCTV